MSENQLTGDRADGLVEAPLLVNAREASRLLAISPRKLWELTNRGEIPCVRFGGAVRYRPQSLTAWVSRREKKGK
jgi:excisionase family DNA binding protein